MTGYARVRKPAAGGELVISIKSLNHRGLDLRFHLSNEMEPFENEMRRALGKKVTRGHADVRVTFNRTPGSGAVGLNRPLLEAYLTAFKQAANEYEMTGTPDAGVALRTPGMLSEPVDQELDAEFRECLMKAFEEVLDGLNAFREREGAQLADVIRQHQQSIQSGARHMAEIRERAVPLFQTRLNERLSELLDGMRVEPQRLAQEAAILADRSDIGEELARLKIHSEQLGALLDEGGEIGKRMDFLLQEMHREANTILSKTCGIGETGLEITDRALGAKADIEKIREQALNLE